MSVALVRRAPSPTAPGASATIVLHQHGVPGDSGWPWRVIVNFLNISHASAASGLKAYTRWHERGTWRQVDYDATMPATVGASVANVDDTRDFETATYPYFKLEYTSGTAPTTWEVIVVLVYGDRGTGR